MTLLAKLQQAAGKAMYTVCSASSSTIRSRRSPYPESMKCFWRHASKASVAFCLF
jgi:hypothetical protein